MGDIGLIAGAGRFPLIFAQEARRNNASIYAVAIEGITDISLADAVDRIDWVKVGELSRVFELLKGAGVKRAVMAGKITQEIFFRQNIKLDGVILGLLAKLSDKKTDTLLKAASGKLKGLGIELIDSRTFLGGYIAKRGLLTRRPLTKKEAADVEFGKDIAKKLGSCDVGQTVVVKDKVILAVEALEGTDDAILRGGRLAKEGAVIVKMAKPGQDMRFDIPVVGPDTIDSIARARASVLAVEKDKTLLVDKDILLKKADDNSISVIGV